MTRNRLSNSTEHLEWLEARRHLARRFIVKPCRADELGKEIQIKIQTMPSSRHDLMLANIQFVSSRRAG